MLLNAWLGMDGWDGQTDGRKTRCEWKTSSWPATSDALSHLFLFLLMICGLSLGHNATTTIGKYFPSFFVSLCLPPMDRR